MSQRREMFRLDAASMGLTASKSNSSFSEDQNECKCNQQQQQEEEQEQEQSSATSSCVDEKKRAQPSLFSHSAECPKKQQQQQQQKQQADAPHSLTSPDSFCRSNMEPVPTEHYRKQLEKLRGICGDASLINFELNGIFLKRLEEIDDLGQQAGDSSSQLRLVTFQDWVDLLLHVNFIIFNNMSNMESESYAKIMNCFQSVRGEQQQVLEENRKLRKDICAIIKLVQEAFHHNNWCTDDMRLETLSVTQLLGIQDTDGRRPESETEKVNKCMKSLASEVAAKHDEICQLQSQLVALDEVVQTARQKLLLKDQCIAQLNQQMAELQSCVSRMSKESGKGSSTLAECDKGSHLELANAGTLSCLFEGLNEKDQQASELLRMLNKELTEFIDLISKKDYQAMECRRKLISCFFERINSERAETQRHLDNLRSQLQYLNCNVDRLDTPAASSTQIEVEGDALLIETLRRRMLNLNECNKELNIKCQRLDAQYKVKLLEVQYTYEAERSINQKNCLALKEIADLLSKLRSADLSYEDIYDDTSTNNPFCTAIMEMYERLNELENSKEGEDLLMANERLVCQVHNLQGALADREHQIQELRTMINGYADISETNKLKDEMSALKLKNSEQSQKVCEIANLLKAQQDERQKLCKNYEKLLDSSEEKYKELRRANRELQSLRDRLAQLEKQQCELTTERDLLREEVIALKEKEAESSGRERALNDQLRCRQQEMDKSRCLLRDMQQHLKHEERQHKETVDRLCRANEEIRLQMHAVAGECKQMHLKLKQQADVNGQQYLIIESFRKWKDAQIRSDDAMRQCVNKAEEHINALLKENHRLCEEYRRLFGDYCLLEEENQTVRNAVNSRQTGGAYSPAKVHRGKEVHDDMTSRLRFLSSTSQRISAQVKALNARHRGIHSRLPDSDEQLTSPQSSSSATKIIYS